MAVLEEPETNDQNSRKKEVIILKIPMVAVCQVETISNKSRGSISVSVGEQWCMCVQVCVWGGGCVMGHRSKFKEPNWYCL